MARGGVGYGAVKIARSIHRWIHTSIGNTPLPISSPREPRKGSKDDGSREGGREAERRRAPEGPLVAQLSHLPIGPSHVLICLLVNPPVPSHPSSLIGYFALSTFVEPLCLFPPSPPPSSHLLFSFYFFFSEGSLSFLFRSPSFRSARTECIAPSIAPK